MKIAGVNRSSILIRHADRKMAWAAALSFVIHLLGIHFILSPLLRAAQPEPKDSFHEISMMECQRAVDELVEEDFEKLIPPPPERAVPEKAPARPIAKKPEKTKAAPVPEESAPAAVPQPTVPAPANKLSVEEAEKLFESLTPEQKKQVILNGSNFPAPFSGMKKTFNKGIFQKGPKTDYCNDGIDNDNDGPIDLDDPDCLWKKEGRKKLLLY